MHFLELSNHPVLRTPLQWRGTYSATGRRPSSPLRRGGRSPGWSSSPLRRQMCIHMCRWRLYRTHPLARTLCTIRLGWPQGNWWRCRWAYSPMGINCSQCPYILRQPRRSPTDMMLMGDLLPAQADEFQCPKPLQTLGNIIQIKSVFVSSCTPISRKENRTSHSERTHIL